MRVLASHLAMLSRASWRAFAPSSWIFAHECCSCLSARTDGDESLPMAIPSRNTSYVDTGLIIDGPRARSEPDRFADSEYSTFTEYELSRLGERHAGVTIDDVDKAREAEPSLAAQLDSLFARVRAAASAPTGSDPASELVGEMERAAATTLHAALLECVRAAGIDEESNGIWTDDLVRANVAVMACLPDAQVPVEKRQWGKLVFAPPNLQWIPTAEPVAVSDDICPLDEMEWPLVSFSGTADDADEAAACQLRLLQGEDDGLLVGFENETDLIVFERTLRLAATSARAALLTPQSTPVAMDSPAPLPAGATVSPATDVAQGSNVPKRQKRSEEPRVQRGRELRTALQSVAKLYRCDKRRQAKEAFKAIPEGKLLGGRAILGRAEELHYLSRDVHHSILACCFE